MTERASNPAVKRFDWIARRYPFAVLVRTFQVWANTVGADAFVALARGETGRHSRKNLCAKGVCTAEQLAHWFVEWLEKQIAGGADPHRVLVAYPPDESPYDRYLPWVAATINRGLKAFWKEADWVIVRMPDNFILGLDDYTPVAQATGQGDVPELSPSQHARYAFHQAAREYQDTYNLLRNELRLLVAYAEAEGLDVGRVKTSEQLESFSARATAWSATQAPKVEVVSGYVLYRFPDGWTIQLLDSHEVLKYESEAMRHCIVDYADPFDEETSYYSLRDPDGRPHATVEHELVSGAWPQVKGVANSVPKLEFLVRLACWRQRSENRGGPLPSFLRPMDAERRVFYEAVAQGPWSDWSLTGAWVDAGGEGWLFYSGSGAPLFVSSSTIDGGALREEALEAALDYAAEEGAETEEEANAIAASVFLRFVAERGSYHLARWEEEDPPSVGWLLWTGGHPVEAKIDADDELVRELLRAGIVSSEQLAC